MERISGNERDNGAIGGKEMDELTDGLQCPRCGTGFPVELNRMRANVPIFCPSCGFSCGVSEEEAIRAHRLLERLEYRKGVVSPLLQSGVMFA
jgi:DNA-directed RNA polymerase subunit RPC12/RpoP